MRVSLDAKAHRDASQRDALHLDMCLQREAQRHEHVSELAHRDAWLSGECERLRVDGEDLLHVPGLDFVRLLLVGAELQ